jgi:hypothetical protein
MTMCDTDLSPSDEAFLSRSLKDPDRMIRRDASEMPGSDFQFSICHTAGFSENADAGRQSRLKIESLTLHPREAVQDVGCRNSALSSFLKNRFMPGPIRLMILLGGG